MDIIRLGELQESGNPLSPGRQYEGGPITIGDTPAFGGMEFFKLNENMYISTQVCDSWRGKALSPALL